MSEKRKEDWIKIFTPKNKEMIASPQYVKKLLGLDLSNIYNRLIHMEEKIDKLESPIRQEKIIGLLRDYGKHNEIWLDNRVHYLWYDLRDLVKKGIVIETISGSQHMFELASDRVEGKK